MGVPPADDPPPRSVPGVEAELPGLGHEPVHSERDSSSADVDRLRLGIFEKDDVGPPQLDVLHDVRDGETQTGAGSRAPDADGILSLEIHADLNKIKL